MAESGDRDTTQDQESERQETERRIREIEQLQQDRTDYGKKMREKLEIRKTVKILKK